MKLPMRICRRVVAGAAFCGLRWGRPLLPTPGNWRTDNTSTCLACASLATSTRLTNSSVTATAASSELQLANDVREFVPPTFASIQQISRQMPAELLEQISSPACGGLRQLLSRYPDLFESKQIGQVHVVRRRSENARGAKFHGGAAQAFMNTRGTGSNPKPGGRFHEDLNTPLLTDPAAKVAMAELRLLFPDFLVPVRALWTTVPERAEAAMRERVLQALRSKQQKWLTFYAHPAHRVVSATSAARDARNEGQLMLEENTSVFENGYVQFGGTVSPSRSTEREVKSETSDDAAPGPQREVCARLAEYKVQPYEWYRVARVLPTAASEVLLDKVLYDAAVNLLPPGHDVWQVLLSAPHLFYVRYADPIRSTVAPHDGTNTPSAVAETSAVITPLPVFVRFILHPRFVPSGMAFVSEEELRRELEEVALNRDESRCGLTTRQRRRKRQLQRQLAYLRNPTPYFDDRVLAQHLFDLLPMQGGVHQSALLGALPSQAVSAFPQNVTDLFKERTDLFRLSDARHGVLVQRADVPLDEPRRTVETVTGEEVLQSIFASYSTRFDPHSGTTISRSLPRLPRLLRDRLFAMQDVVQELLRMYPEKVEVMDDGTGLPATTGSRQHQEEAEMREIERARRELQSVRGRRDFLVRFRFVGEWEAKLMEKYTKQQEKELAKSRARHGTAHTRRHPYPPHC
jgi:hypothetical protein